MALELSAVLNGASRVDHFVELIVKVLPVYVCLRVNFSAAVGLTTFDPICWQGL